jgi:hypothetical protein
LWSLFYLFDVCISSSFFLLFLKNLVRFVWFLSLTFTDDVNHVWVFAYQSVSFFLFFFCYWCLFFILHKRTTCIVTYMRILKSFVAFVFFFFIRFFSCVCFITLFFLLLKKQVLKHTRWWHEIIVINIPIWIICMTKTLSQEIQVNQWGKKEKKQKQYFD